MHFIPRLVATTAVSLFALTAHAGLVTFESDAAGAKPNPFTSNDDVGVTFTDTLGIDLQVMQGLGECKGGTNKCLVAFNDDTSAIQMDFAVLANQISLEFGNDQAGFISADGLALLQMYLGNLLVAEASVTVNLNDAMDQTVSYFGVSFDRAVFAYSDVNKARVSLIETIDNVSFTSANNVPEPASLALVAMVLAGMGVSRRARKAA